MSGITRIARNFKSRSHSIVSIFSIPVCATRETLRIYLGCLRRIFNTDDGQIMKIRWNVCLSPPGRVVVEVVVVEVVVVEVVKSEI